MRVSLMVTCLVDGFWPEVGVATTRLLRRLGCEVTFDRRQTCCGQPAYNTGYLDEARRVARTMVDVFAENDADAIVMPSGSCCAMVQHAPGLFEGDDAARERAASVASRTHELASFLVHELGVTDVGAKFEGRVAWHDGCHGLRDLGVRDEPRALLRAVQGLELVEPEGEPTCCGFGGTFAVKQPEVSVAMADVRLAALCERTPDVIASSDVSCLMQLEGRVQRTDPNAPKAMHLAQILDAR